MFVVLLFVVTGVLNMEASTIKSNLEKRIVKLARDISDAVDSVIPRLLLQIQGAYAKSEDVYLKDEI